MSKNPPKSNRRSPSNTEITVPLLALIGVVVTAFFGYLTVIRPQELSIEATRTAEAKPALVPAMPGAISTSTPLPVPHAKISEPLDGQRVSTNAEVVTEYWNIPGNRYLWVAVRIPAVRPVGLIYPQLKEMKLPPQLVGTGIYKTYAALGSEKDVEAPFNVIVLLADQTAHDLITAYAKTCSFNPGSCAGMPLPETGIEILDFVTVIRQ